MKRVVVTAVFLCAVPALGGCPIYSHEDDGCYRNSDCGNGYVCEDSTGFCVLPGGNSNDTCARPADCGVNQTCNRSGQCVAGDCSFSSCVAGFECDSSSGAWQCVPTASSPGNEAGAAGASAVGGAGSGGTSGAEAGSAGAIDTAGSGGEAQSLGGAAGQAGGG